MFWIFDMYVCIPNNQFQIYELTFWNHILGRLHQRLNTIKRKIIEGLKRIIKRNKFDKDSNAHLILRLHLLHLLNCFWWWWWWCWWVQLILFFIFSPPFTSWWMSSLCTSDASSQSHSGCTHTHNSFYIYIELISDLKLMNTICWPTLFSFLSNIYSQCLDLQPCIIIH